MIEEEQEVASGWRFFFSSGFASLLCEPRERAKAASGLFVLDLAARYGAFPGKHAQPHHDDADMDCTDSHASKVQPCAFVVLKPGM